MKTRYRISLLALVFAAVFTLTYQGNAQRPRNRAKVHSLQATSERPDTQAITVAGTITCLSAVSETPNVHPAPSCHVTAPGFNGDLSVGKTVTMTDAGTVILKCSGQGNLRCNARVDTPS